MQGQHFAKQTQRERACSLVHGTWRCAGAEGRQRRRVRAHGRSAAAAERGAGDGMCRSCRCGGRGCRGSGDADGCGGYDCNDRASRFDRACNRCCSGGASHR